MVETLPSPAELLGVYAAPSRFALGELYLDRQANRRYRFVKAGAAVAAGPVFWSFVSLDGNQNVPGKSAGVVSTSGGPAGQMLAALGLGQYGFIQVSGSCPFVSVGNPITGGNIYTITAGAYAAPSAAGQQIVAVADYDQAGGGNRTLRLCYE